METLRSYLETMFLNLPNTPQVQRAKNELWQMMEDKYTELKEEGKSENEAIGIVISEFGNLDELADDLGIGGFMNQGDMPMGRQLSMDEAGRFLKEKSRHAYMIALGVLLCIISPCGTIFGNAADDLSPDSFPAFGLIGTILLFVLVAIAVGLFIYSGTLSSHWNYLKRESCRTNYATTQFVHQQKETFKTTYALMLTLGVILCILSFVPPIILDWISEFSGNYFLDEISVLSSHWNYLKRESCRTNYATTQFVHQQKETFKTTYALMLTLGVILCILSFVPPIILDWISEFSGNYFLDEISGSFFLIFVAIGVFMLVYASAKMGSYNDLLNLNRRDTVGGSYTTSQEENVQYEDKTVAAIMSVYWPTVTCLYLIWSFLSFDWGITWIIWVIAAIIHTLIKNLLGKQQ